MRIPSGVTDQYIYFVAVDSADFTTRETGLSSFTVYRSRNGAAAAAMTTPTVNETDATNMPGVYELLLDEDMSIGAGNDSEEMVFHITATGMAPVTRTIELYRPKITAGNTLGVAATGDISGNIDGNVDGSVASVTAGVTLANGAVTNASLAGNMEIVFETDFATNYNTTRNAWATNVQDTVGTGTLGLNDLSAAEVNTEVDTALTDIGLDHLLSAAVTGTDVTDNSVMARLVSGSATADWDDFVNTTDSLQAIRDRGDTAWITGGGGGLTQVLNVVPLIPQAIDLANTATYRLGLALVNSLDDLPTTAEITPGTIDIDRKAKGGTSWTSVVSGAACSEAAGLVYYDEVFDSATGYAEGDMIRVTFYSQSITADSNTHEVSDATEGRIFYTGVLSATPDVNVAQISGSATAADNAEVVFDTDFATNYNPTRNAWATNVQDTVGTGTLGLNDLSSADVNAEVDTALTDIHLDHLLAADYDPASPPGTATALLNELIESDAGVSRFTANALEQAPSGGGSSDWTSGEREEIRGRLGITGTTAAGGNTPTLSLQATVDAIETDTQDIQSRLPSALVGGRIDANVGAVSGDATAADNLELDYDGTGYNKANSTIGTTTTNTDMRGTDSASTHSAADVWAVATRVLTANTNLNDLDAAGIRAAIGMAAADLDTQLGTLATAAALSIVDGIVDNLNLGIIYGVAQTGTLSTTQATTDLTGYANDELIGRVIIFTGGTADGQASDITDYASASGLVTFTAITTAPANNDTFKIV